MPGESFMLSCTDCMLFVMILLLIMMLVGVLIVRWRHRDSAERFNSAQISASLLDERCRLNSNVSVDTGLDMVRHPTDSHTGNCVLRGQIPGNGRCDSTNTVLYDPSYVSSVDTESVDGRRECVVRVHQGLSDDQARSYGHALSKNNIEMSAGFKALMKQRLQCTYDNTQLTADLLAANELTTVANNNLRDQIVSDDAAMKAALQLQRDDDARTLVAAVDKRSKENDDAKAELILAARADEQNKASILLRTAHGRSVVAMRNEFGKSAAALQAEVDSSMKAITLEQTNSIQAVKEEQERAVSALHEQTEASDTKLKHTIAEGDAAKQNLALAAAQKQEQVQALAAAKARLQAAEQQRNQARDLTKQMEQTRNLMRDKAQALEQERDQARSRTQAFEQERNLARADVQVPNQYMVVLGDLHTQSQNLGEIYVGRDNIDRCRDQCTKDMRCTHLMFNHQNGVCYYRGGLAMYGQGFYQQNGWSSSRINVDRYPKS